MNQAKTDFDSPWKDLLEWYFEAFIEFCFPDIHASIDWSRPHEFLDKELQKIVRDADLGKRFADKLVKVWLRDGQELWLLCHVEVQGQKEASFPQRMYRYNYRISDRYNHPVVSLAVLCDANFRWRPTQFKQQIMGCEIEFTFPIVKLLDYKEQWAMLEQSSNPFATVIRAHLKAQETRRDQQQRKLWKFTLTRQLYERGYAKPDILNLFHFIDWVMALSDELEQAFRQELTNYEQERSMRYVTSIERMAKQEGRQEEAARLIEKLLQHKFSTVSPEVQTRLQKLDVEQLEMLLDAAIMAELLTQFLAQLTAIEATTPAKPKGTRRRSKAADSRPT